MREPQNFFSTKIRVKNYLFHSVFYLFAGAAAVGGDVRGQIMFSYHIPFYGELLVGPHTHTENFRSHSLKYFGSFSSFENHPIKIHDHVIGHDSLNLKLITQLF